jgi:hypothetical protein
LNELGPIDLLGPETVVAGAQNLQDLLLIAAKNRERSLMLKLKAGAVHRVRPRQNTGIDSLSRMDART